MNANKPVLVITCHAWFGDMVGGSFKVATEQAIDLAKRGFRVCYVCSSSTESHTEDVREIEGVEVWSYPPPQARSPSLSNIRCHVNSTRDLIERISKTGHIAAIGGHTPLQFRGAIAATKRIGCANLIYHLHSPFHEELKAQWESKSFTLKQRAALFLAQQIERHNLRNATQVQCFSDFSKSLIKQIAGESVSRKTLVAPGWVDCSRFKTVPNRDEARSQLSKVWKTGKKIFFTLRRLEPRMGMQTLCEAAKLLSESRNDFRVVIGGAGSQSESLKRYVADAHLEEIVFLPGRLSDAEVELAYSAADCFVLPTTALECFGLIILESWANNLPVISSKVGAIPELVRQQQGEWMFDAGDARQLAERMALFLDGQLVTQTSLTELAEQYDSETGLNRLFEGCYSQFQTELVAS